MPQRPRLKPRTRRYENSPEAAMAKEHSAYTPFKINLYYLISEFDPDDIHVAEIFARGPNPEMARLLAERAWLKHSRASVALPTDKYPDLQERAEVEVLDDGDYLEQWRVAQKYKRYWIGVEQNPLCFAYFPDGKIIDTAESKTSIIIP